MSYIVLDTADLAIAASLVVLAAILSIVLRLGLARSLAVAAVRMVVQLTLVGLILKVLFETVSPWLTGAVALVMLGFAGREILSRQKRRFAGLWTYGIGSAAMIIAGTVVTGLALTTQLQPDPWYDPRYAIPLLGMILGNAMNGVSIGLDRLMTSVAREKAAIEAQLALGHDRQTAFRPFVREAVRAGLINVVNAMSASGLVFLPGMMTGQILAGVEPTDAVRYQILIMFLLSGANAIGVLVAVYAAQARLSDARHRLRLDRVATVEA